MLDIYTRKNGAKWNLDAVICEKRMPGREAKLAITLIERWGMVAAKHDGEDSAGRACLTLQTPEELVERACKTAELAFAELERRGWMLHMPEQPAEESPEPVRKTEAEWRREDK